ncbi:MAG: hypothetical protein AAGC55_04905 [Myxococcota bacterium]
MNLLALMVLYLLVGAGCACARLAWRARPRGRVADAALLFGLWPLYGPFLLISWQGEPEVASSEVAFLVALRRAGQTPLGQVLPDEATVRGLAGRLRVAASKVSEIDALLARPEFSEQDALARRDELARRSASECAVSTASMRVQNIRRLRALRNRFATELDEVGELLAQLSTQAEVVRLAGGLDSSSADLIRELVSRVEGLDQVLDDDPQMLDA